MKHLLTLLLLSLCLTTNAQTKLSILGDSYSTFEGYLQPDTNAVWYRPVEPYNDVNRVEQTWWHVLCEQTGLTLEVNNSFSGSTICNTGYGGVDYSDRSFITRMDNLGAPDIILVFGGTNDSWAGAPIGDYEWSASDARAMYSYRPALDHMLHYLKTHYAQARIYFILNSELSPAINESTLTLCGKAGIPVVQLHDIDKQLGHPSIRGMQAIAEQVGAAIAK